MRLSTKLAAVLWLGTGVYAVAWRLYHGAARSYTLMDFAVLAAMICLVAIVPAVLLLWGRASGWWLTVILSVLVMAQVPVRMIMFGHGLSTETIAMVVWCALVLALLLADRPSRWETSGIGATR